MSFEGRFSFLTPIRSFSHPCGYRRLALKRSTPGFDNEPTDTDQQVPAKRGKAQIQRQGRLYRSGFWLAFCWVSTSFSSSQSCFPPADFPATGNKTNR